MSLESRRFVEQVFRYLDGEEQAILDWLVKLGCTVTIPGDGLTAPVLRGVTGIAGSLAPSDPVNVAVQMCMLVLGEWWPFVVPTLLNEVNAEWRARGGRLAARNGTPVPPKQTLPSAETTVVEKDVQLSFLPDNETTP